MTSNNSIPYPFSIAPEPVTAEKHSHVGYITLNRQESLNCLNLSMVRMIHGILEAWQFDADISMVVLKGSGERAFCAGGDLRMLYDSYKSCGSEHINFFQEQYALDEFLRNFKKPVIAFMSGFVLGGGMGLAQSASIRIVTESAVLGMPEVAIGFFPDVGASYFLPKVPGRLGLYLALTGKKIRAADALYCGLADYYMASRDQERLFELFERIEWTGDAEKDVCTVLHGLTTRHIPGSELKAYRNLIDQVFGASDIENIREALIIEEGLHAVDWAEETLKQLDRNSPLAMKVAHRLYDIGEISSSSECYRLEAHVANQWLQHGDMIEGIRSLIIDKDFSPAWKHLTLKHVTTAEVDRFLQQH